MQMPRTSSSTCFVIAPKFLCGRDDAHRVLKSFGGLCRCVRFLPRELADWILADLGKHSVQQPHGRAYVLAAVVDFFLRDSSARNVIQFPEDFELTASTLEAQTLIAQCPYKRLYIQESPTPIRLITI